MYIATNITSGIRYIGVTKHSINKRYSPKSQKHYFTRCYIDNPEDFKFQIIPCETIELAYELEELIVDQEVIKSPMFYNKSIGGVRYPTLTEETKDKISKALKGKSTTGRPKGYKHTVETKAKMSEASKGKPKSAEHKANMVKAAKGRKMSPEHKAKLSKASLGRKMSPESIAKREATKAANRLAKLNPSEPSVS